MRLTIPSINIGDKDSIRTLNELKNALVMINQTTQYEGTIEEDDGTYICDTNDVIAQRVTTYMKCSEVN